MTSSFVLEDDPVKQCFLHCNALGETKTKTETKKLHKQIKTWYLATSTSCFLPLLDQHFTVVICLKDGVKGLLFKAFVFNW